MNFRKRVLPGRGRVPGGSPLPADGSVLSLRRLAPFPPFRYPWPEGTVRLGSAKDSNGEATVDGAQGDD